MTQLLKLVLMKLVRWFRRNFQEAAARSGYSVALQQIKSPMDVFSIA